MQFERLKKSHKKEIIIGALAVCAIGGALTFATTRAKYKVTENIKLVDGTINYKPYDFKVMAIYQQNDSGTYTEINEMPSSGYVINEDKTYCTTDNQTEVKGKIKTIDGNVAITNLNKSDKCYLYFDKKKEPSEETLAKLKITSKDGTPNFVNKATTDEGVYAVSDGMYGGTSYYWRGAVTNNYVKFAGFCWRIIRINGDGSIRLIYDGTTCHTNGEVTTNSIAVSTKAYNSNYKGSEYVGYTYTTGAQRGSATSSDLKIQNEKWYNSKIGNNTSYSIKIAEGKFCNDRNTAYNSSWYSQPSSYLKYAGYIRSGANVETNVTPTLSCIDEEDIYILKVGVITMDEVIMAGGKWGTTNQVYYLYNGQNYWTMTPVGVGDTPRAYVYIVNNYGKLVSDSVNYTTVDSVIRGNIRPVINLKADITFSSGDGTLNSPYTVTD